MATIGNFLVAIDYKTGNAPKTYLLDGRRYILQAAGDTLYAFALYEP